VNLNLNPFDLSGKIALISGASGSLGSAAAVALGAAGAAVAVAGRDLAVLEPVVDGLRERGIEATAVAGDPLSPESVHAMVATAASALGPIDILVTAAGMNKPAPIVEQSVEDWDAIVDSQLKTTWLLCKEVGATMIERGAGGKVVLIGSQRGSLGMANYSAYSPAKAAVHLLARTLAWEWGPHGINVNCVAPGLFRSSLTEWMWDDEEVYKRLLARIPVGRLGEAYDCTGAIVYLASAASDFVTGSVLAVDGGYTAG